MSKEEFKTFAKKHPELIKEVTTNKASWQQLYEMYEIYGENDGIWQNYLNKNNEIKDKTTIQDFIDMLKKIDLNSIQKGVNNIQKTITLLQDMSIKEETKDKTEYEPRPLYRYFED